MKKLFKKYIFLAFVMSMLFVILGISYTVDEINISEVLFKIIYAAETDQSSTQTTKNESEDMIDLLARVINAEARGEPYLRSSSSWCCYNE